VDEHHPEEVEQSWETCSRAIKDYDNHMVRNWKEEIDTLLVFVWFSCPDPYVQGTHFWFTGRSVLGDYHCIYHRFLQMAPAGPNRSLRSAPFQDIRTVGRIFQPNLISKSRSDGFSTQHLGRCHQHPLVFQPRMLIGRRSHLYPCQTMDTRIHAVHSHFLARGHIVAAIPV